MKTIEFNFELPEKLIARYPLSNRTESRLLCLEQTQIKHQMFTDLPEMLSENDVLIFNNTRVMPARLFATKKTGGKVEILIERLLDEFTAWALLKSNHKLILPCELILAENSQLKVIERKNDLFKVICNQPLKFIMQEQGVIPLPPYLERAAEELDFERYQTVYASREGAVAAPTAGLHFDQSLMDKITAKGIQIGFITLHVGAGTFKPVTVAEISHHQMHPESYEIPQVVCDKINHCRRQGGKIIAVGTTTVRALEAAAQDQCDLIPSQGETQIFIYPGYRFKCVDAMITNFHLPKSTLLMLVCAFGGYLPVMSAYEAAIHHQYRFYSYGDAMFLSRETR